jgi:hypothetical protein
MKLLNQRIVPQGLNRRLKEVTVAVPRPVSKKKGKSQPPVNRVYADSYFEVPVLNIKRVRVGTVELNHEVFGEQLRSDIIYRCLRHRVLQRRNADGIKPTKTISNIRGSGAKIRPQKG